MTLNQYIEEHISNEPSLLSRITRDTYLHQLNPHMVSGHLQGRLLSMLSRMIRPQRILELGTFTGYSTLCLAEGLQQDGQIITIEHNDELEETITRNFSQSPWNQQIRLLIGDAVELLRSSEQIREQAPFDLVFIDADKRQYTQYYQLVLPLVRQAGFIIADNTLWDGHIIDPDYDNDHQTQGLRLFNDLIAQDQRVEKVILPLRDGLTIIQVKS